MSHTILQTLFGFDNSKMTVRKEVTGGITSFLTMAYILAVNPMILSSTGMDQNAVFTSTAVSAIVATLIMAFYAKLPFALAPGMGLNAFFAYTVVLAMGYRWQFALTAVLIEGLIFIFLTLTDLRQKIVDCLPPVFRHSIAPGIGLFITFIGLKNAGIVVKNEATLVSLGNLHDPAVILACAGIVISTILLVRKVTGALLIGILLVTAIGIPLGITKFTTLVSAPPSLEPVFCQFEWNNLFCLDMVICVFTLLFFDIFDTIGTIVGVSERAGIVNKDGNIPRLKQAFTADAVGTAAGALLGTSTVTTFVESAAGVNEGGRSGLTAFTTAVCFAAALFFAPLFLAVPPQATAPALILVGAMMMGSVGKIDFNDYASAVPCFVCMSFIPLTCSISEGMLLGIISWVLIHLCCGKVKGLNPGMIILSVLFLLRYIFL